VSLSTHRSPPQRDGHEIDSPVVEAPRHEPC
jgi:hypothetical protein